jgi:Helix-turn-helix domain
VADVYAALADATRRAILDELTERDGQTLFELCARLAMKHGLGSSRQAISQGGYHGRTSWVPRLVARAEMPTYRPFGLPR